MGLKDVRRRTPAKEAIEALRNHGACEEALSWAGIESVNNPKLTAQGLWNACKAVEWLEWLVDEIGDECLDSELIWSYGGDDPRPCRCSECNPEESIKACKEIRAAYESPWLP